MTARTLRRPDSTRNLRPHLAAITWAGLLAGSTLAPALTAGPPSAAAEPAGGVSVTATATTTSAPAPATPAPPAPASPCLADPAYRAFDFWLGEWDVVPTGKRAGDAGVPVSRSSIQSILQGCVLLENWSGAGGYDGKSFNRWSAHSRQWRQTWVDSAGAQLDFAGSFDASGNLVYTGTSPVAPGNPALLRHELTFIPQGKDQVRQVWRQSKDDGKTWAVVFDGTYTRRPADGG